MNSFPKCIYVILIVLYASMVAVWFFRYPISYEIAGVRPELLEERNLTRQEFKALKKAITIRQWTSKILVYGSLFVFGISSLFLRYRWLNAIIIIKIVMIVSGLIALLLIFTNGIAFIPGPPMR